MFEKILEKVLLSHFGKYLTGFDKNNLKLGVWSGNVVIENVKLKNEIIEGLELPIELLFSSIGRLAMQVPWNKLSSSPVEVLIEDIIIIVAPKDPKNWDFSDMRLTRKKFQVLQNYANQMFDRLLKRKGETEDQQGYLDKLTLRVIDNLQLQVRNIHIRWEAPQANYAWGIRLKSLEAFTTSQDWSRMFIDRTDEKNKLTPINKLVKLEQLFMYWNSKEQQFFDGEVQILQQDSNDEVINITAELKLTQNVRTQFDRPYFDIALDLNWIDINLKHSQLKQLIQILESISLYTKLLWMERKGVGQIQQNQEIYQGRFTELFSMIMKSEQKTLDQLDEDEVKELMDITKLVDYDTLFSWTQAAMKQVILETKVQELQKQKNKKGWFGWGGGNTDTTIQDTEIKEIEEYIETNIDAEPTVVVRSPLSVKYKIFIILRGGSLLITKMYNQECDGLQLNSEMIEFNIQSKQNTDFEADFSVNTVGANIFSKQGNQEPKLQSLCYQTAEVMAKQDKFFKFYISKSNNQNIKVRTQVQPVVWMYNSALLQFIREFKNVKQGSLDESLKSATWQRLEKIQDTTQNRVSFLLKNAIQLDMQVQIDNFTLIVPISQFDAWQVNIKGISINSRESDSVYELFDVTILDMTLSNGQDMIFKNYTMNYHISKIRQAVKYIQDDTHMKVQAILPPLKIQLTEKLIENLIYFPEAIFPAQTENQRLEDFSQQKAAILRQTTKKGYVKRRGEVIRVWTKCYMVLSGAYLYLYDNETTLIHQQAVYIKNAVITNIPDEEFAFQLENRYDICYLAFENDNESQSWIQEIQKKVKEYATEEEYIKMNEEAQSVVKKRSSKLHFELKMEVSEMKLFKGHEFQDILIHSVTQQFSLILKREEGLIETTVGMKNFMLRDWTFRFENPQFQDLVTISGDQECLHLVLSQYHTTHPKYQGDLVVDCRVNNLAINWKPDSFLKLRAFKMIADERKSSKRYYQQVKDYEVDALKKGLKPEEIKLRKLSDAMNESIKKCDIYSKSKERTKNHFNKLIDYDSYIQNYSWIYQTYVKEHHSQQSYQKPSSLNIQVNCSIQQAKINFFQMQSHACLFKLDAENLNFTFRSLRFTNFLDCSIQEVSLYDMTNYPHSVDSNKEYNKVIPFKLIGRRPNTEKDTLVKFRFAGYDEIIFPNADRVNVYLMIDIAPLFAIYQHQPIMRIIDYIVVQIVSLLKEPEFLTMNAAVLAEKKQKRNLKNPLKARKVWGDIGEVLQKFICPTFVDCRVSLRRPNLQVKGWPQFDQYFQVDANQIMVFNGQRTDDSRLLRKGGIQLTNKCIPDGRITTAWTESYFVEARQLTIEYSDKGVVKGMTVDQNFNLSFERLLHQNEVQEIYPEVEYDRHLRIRSAMTPIILKAYRDEYLEICRMIFHNFQYDDFMDRIYIHDFEVVRSFDPSPISFYLDFEQLSIYALSDQQKSPLAQVKMQRMRLKWLRDKQMNIELDIFSEVCTMYHYVDEGDYIVEKGFVGDLMRNKYHQLQGDDGKVLLDRCFYDRNAIKEQFDLYEFQGFDEKNMQFILLFKIIRPQGEKNIYIYLKDVKMVVQLSVFSNVGLWSLLDQRCWPPQNDFGEMPGIQLFVEIRNASLCLPAVAGNQVMATKGEISYVWNRVRMPNHQWMIMQQKENKLNPSLVQGIGDAFEHKITLQSLELFKCNMDEFVRLPIQEVGKRNVILPFSFFMGIKNELHILSGSEPVIYYSNKYEANMDKAIIKFSYQDLIVLMNIIEYNKLQTQLIRRPLDQVPQPQPKTPLNNVYDAIIHGLQIVIINDAGQAYVPVFDFTLYESQLIFHQTKTKSILSTVISLSSTFFNPMISVWEPIIERCTFALDMSLNQNSNPKKYIILEMNSPQEQFNINISAQMINIFHKTSLSWAKDIKAQKDEEEQKERKETSIRTSKFGVSYAQLGNGIEAIDHASPYTIRNETGFQMVVEDDIEQNNTMKYIIPPGGSANYQVDADIEQVFLKDQSKGQRLIKFKILDFDYINRVDLDSLQVRKVQVQGKEKNHTLFIEVVPKDTRKLLLITSEIMIYNKTDKKMTIKFFECHNENEVNVLEIDVEPFRALSVPFDRTRGFMSFRFANFDGRDSQCLDLDKLLDIKDRVIECEHSNQYFTLLRCTKRGANQLVLYLEPPYTIKNCLPNQIGYEIFSDEHEGLRAIAKHVQYEQVSIDITPQQHDYSKNPLFNLRTVNKSTQSQQEEIQIHNISQSKRLALKVKYPYYQWSDLGLLNNPFAPQTNKKQSQIQMCDYRGKIGNIEVLFSQVNGSKKYYLYVQAFAVNDTKYSIYFFTSQERKQRHVLAAGQFIKDLSLQESSKTVLLGDPSFTYLSLYEEIQSSTLSKELNMNQTGNDSVSLGGPTDLQVYELGVNISLVLVDQSQQLLTKVLTLSPRFVLVNYTKLDMYVCQLETISQIVVHPQQRVPFTWNRFDKPKLFKIQLKDQNQIWGYSQPIDPNQPGFTSFTLRNQKYRSSIKYIKCQMRVQDQIIYLLFQDCKNAENEENEIPYVIVNSLSDVTLACYQSCFKDNQDGYSIVEYKTMVPPMKEMPFAWEYPTKAQRIIIEMRFESIQNFNPEPIEISLEDTDLEKEYVLTQGEQQYRFYLMTSWEGQSKKIKIYQEDQIHERNKQEDIIELQFGVSINQVGISVLDYDQDKRVELLFITMKNIEFMLLETSSLRTSQLKIKYFNIDNNSSTRTMFPVIMTPTKYQEIFEFDRPQLSLVIVHSTQAKTLTLIKSIRAWLQPTTIRLTSEVLENVYSFFKNIQQQLESNLQNDNFNMQQDFEYAVEFELRQTNLQEKEKNFTLNNQVQSKFGQNSTQNPDDQNDWQIAEIPLQAKTTYIDRIEIYPLQLNITFFLSVHSTVQYGTLMRILKTVGLVIGNIDEAPIKLDGIYLENCFDTSSGITQKLATHYKDNLIQQLHKIIGSIELIGNPVGLIQNIGIGVYDLFDKPIEGFIKGPIEGGIGIGKGILSLLKNTVSGTSNSFGKISGSIAGVCSTISYDPIYQTVREERRIAKPKQLFRGIQYGVNLLWLGVSKGVTGVVYLPALGYREGGVSGGAIGVLKGSLGLLAKPIAGMFDFGSKTAEGIKATAQYWDDKANEKREREIRVMYAQEQFYKGYSEKDAFLMAFLQCNWMDKFGNINLYESFWIGQQLRVLILSLQYVMMIDYPKKKILWFFESKLLIKVEALDYGVMFFLREMDKTVNSMNAIVNCDDNQMRHEICQKSKWLMKSVQ